MTAQAQPLTRTHYLRRALFGLMLLLVLVGALVGVLSFATPAETRVYGLGSLDRFAPDTVTTYAVREGRLLELTYPLRDREPGVVFHVVRLPDGELLALSAKDPHRGCTVVASPAGSPQPKGFEGSGIVARFHTPCHGEQYDLAGRRVFGPSPRDLDRYAVSVSDRGIVSVDLGALTLGASPPPYTGGPSGPAQPTSTPAPRATAPARSGP